VGVWPSLNINASGILLVFLTRDRLSLAEVIVGETIRLIAGFFTEKIALCTVSVTNVFW
jgi:hypothetical protein